MNFLKNKKNLILTFFLLLIFVLLLFYLKKTYSINIDNDNRFMEDNIEKLNSVLENTYDINNSYYIRNIYDDNGNVPAYEYYSDSQVESRSINDIVAYQNKLFLGLGDYDNNTGPVKIIYYNTESDKIESSGTIPDEEVQNFMVVDNKLYTTGTDPRSDWGYGSYYVYNLENNNWDQYEFNNGWVHVYDFEEYNNKLFMCGSALEDGENTPIQVSYDNGETFENVKIVDSDGNQLPYDSYIRFYSLFKYNNNLYGGMRYNGSSSEYNGIYKYDEENNLFKFIQTSIPLTYPFKDSSGSTINGYPAFERYLYTEILNFNNKDLYISGQYLYSLYDIGNEQIGFEKINIDTNYAIQNAVINEDEMYLLSYYYNEDSSFNIRVYRTKDLEKFDIIYEFTADSFPYSIEFFNNKIYIGTYGTEYIKDLSSVGSLYEIDLSKLERKLVLNDDNTITVSADGIDFLVDFNNNNDNIEFNTILSFNENMSKNEWLLEFNKIKNIGLLYIISANRISFNYENSNSYFNDIIKKNISNDLSSYNSVEDFIGNVFKNDLNIICKRFNITSNELSAVEGEYNFLITLTVSDIDDTISSENYVISEENNYIFIGEKSDEIIVESNINYSDSVDIEIDYDNDKLILMKDEEKIREYTLIYFTTSYKILDDCIYVYDSTEQEILSSINLSIGELNIDNGLLEIHYNDIIVHELNLIKVSSGKYTFINENYIYIGNDADSEIRKQIKVVNGESYVYDKKIKITNSNNIVAEMELLSIKFGNLSEKHNTIAIPDDFLHSEFVNNVTMSEGITFKIFDNDNVVADDYVTEGMVVKIYYEDKEIDSYNIINEYLKFDEIIKVNEEERIISNIIANKDYKYIRSKIETTGNITFRNAKDEIMSDNSFIGTGSRITVDLTKDEFEYLVLVNGDVDGDGTITHNDINKIADYVYYSKDELTGIYLSAADYDNNRCYNLIDIMKAANRSFKDTKRDNLANKIIDYYNESSDKIETVVNNEKYYLDTFNNLISDRDGNIRYYGANPNNYIYFNCDTYPSTNCEIWRIIGVFEGKIKIIRTNSIGKFSWDTSTSDVGFGWGVDDWANADLMKLLNPNYEENSELDSNGESTIVNNSLYWQGKEGTLGKCFSGRSNTIIDCDFRTIGLKNNATRYMIANSLYNIDGIGITPQLYVDEIYNNEKNGDVWYGKIAIANTSDLGYASDLNNCKEKLYDYFKPNCYFSNWMFSIFTDNSRLLNVSPPNILPITTISFGNIITVDELFIGNQTLAYPYEIVPVLFLNSDIAVCKDGDGSKNNPFKLCLD